jgi:hypothetical protein
MRSLLPLAGLIVSLACRSESRLVTGGGDSGSAGVQSRGAVAMGVNQYTSTHLFTPLPDGGRIELQRNGADSAGAEQVRRHMAMIARQFAAGDFRLPGFVHARDVPGTAVMAAKRADLRYTVESLPRGAALRIRTTDLEAIAAIHAFLAFQRQDHHAGASRDS